MHILCSISHSDLDLHLNVSSWASPSDFDHLSMSHANSMRALLAVIAVGGAALVNYALKLRKENRRLADQLAVLAYHTSKELENAAAASGPTELEHDKPITSRLYEQDRLVQEYLMMHYGENEGLDFIAPGSGESKDEYTLQTATAPQAKFGNFGEYSITEECMHAPQFPTFALNFPVRVAKVAIHFVKKAFPQGLPAGRALDVGCSVGRTAFELTTFFEEVVGLDYSFAFIDAAKSLKAGETLEYSFSVEGTIRRKATAKLEDAVNPDRVTFVQGDATRLGSKDLGGQFQCVVAANLIDRLPAPRRFLASCSELLASGGVLVLTSPYTWLKEYTPRNEWLQNETKSTFDTLVELLSPNFDLIHNSHMPFLIRETGRKSQFTLTHLTVWKRK